VVSGVELTCRTGDGCNGPLEDGGIGGSLDAQGTPGADVAAPSAYPPDSVPPTWARADALAYSVVDAEFIVPSGLIVMASDRPANALHLYYPPALDLSVPLPSAPVALALDPSGVFAAVVTSAQVTVVDLNARAVKWSCPLAFQPFDVALSTGGAIAYVAPRAGQGAVLHAIGLADCSDATASGVSFDSAHLALDPVEPLLFLASPDPPGDLYHCVLPQAAAPFVCSSFPSLQGDDFCANAWISADGQRLYTGCGIKLWEPAQLTYSWGYGGTLPGVQRIGSLCEAPVLQRALLVPQYDTGGPTADPRVDTVVRVYDTVAVKSVVNYQLPVFPARDQPSHGRFVFATPNMATIYVIAQPDATSQVTDDFAVATLAP
jgi:hypothetical protein